MSSGEKNIGMKDDNSAKENSCGEEEEEEDEEDVNTNLNKISFPFVCK